MKNYKRTFFSRLFISPIKKSSVLSRKRYGAKVYCKPENGSILGNRKYSKDISNRTGVSKHDESIKKNIKEN